jgi:hypothetical protein
MRLVLLMLVHDAPQAAQHMKAAGNAYGSNALDEQQPLRGWEASDF